MKRSKDCTVHIPKYRKPNLPDWFDEIYIDYKNSQGNREVGYLIICKMKVDSEKAKRAVLRPGKSIEVNNESNKSILFG